MNRLRHMAVFAHIVQAGSITGAADSLNLSKSVVSQHLKALEKTLGISLLKRTTRRQTLTDAGEQFYQQCLAMNALVDNAWQQAQQTLEVPQGKVRITAPHALMGTLVAPAIAQVMLKYPLITVELIASDAQLSLIGDEIDLAIRVGPSEASSVKQQRIGQFRDVLCGLKRVVSPGDLQTLPYVANQWQGETIEHQFKHLHTGEKCHYSPNVRCRADSFHACLALIESGAGIGLVPDFVLKQRNVTVKPVLVEYQLPVNPVYALHPYEALRPLSVTVCLQAIADQLPSTEQG